jgi:type II secretory pathway pseudopilin PulG
MELMVVLVIMGVLIGMSAPRFGRAIEQSRANLAVANLRAIWAAQRLYWLENCAYTDKLTQASPKGLFELGLLDPAIVSTTGDYTYTVPSADSNAFQAKATRVAGTGWTGWFTIDQNGTTDGSISATGQPNIIPGFQ